MGILKNKKKPTDKDLLDSGFYKGYDIRWLRNEPSHPDYYLVAEYDAKYSNKE